MDLNRQLWDEWTDIHEGSTFYDLEGFLRGGVRLRDYELAEIGDLEGRTVLHLQCHFGIDTLSFARLGAVPTGADFSPKATALARRLASETGLGATFVESNLYDLPANLEGEFEIVYTSRGVLGWLPDIGAWGQVAAHFVKPGGIFYITEGHPVAMAFAEELPLRPIYPYWSHPEPLVFDTKGSYADPEADVRTPREYGWDHSLGEIVQSLIDAGLTIELLRERPFVDWDMGFTEQHEDGFWYLPGSVEGELPLSFSLRARKPSTAVRV